MRLQVSDKQASEALNFLRTSSELQPGFETTDTEAKHNSREG
jgi:hypothetical protein